MRVLLAVAAFAVLLNPLGLVLTPFSSCWWPLRPATNSGFGEALLSAVVLALFSYVLFVWALNQTMPVWPWFLPSDGGAPWELGTSSAISRSVSRLR